MGGRPVITALWRPTGRYYESEASLSYLVSTRVARATYQDPSQRPKIFLKLKKDKGAYCYSASC